MTRKKVDTSFLIFGKIETASGNTIRQIVNIKNGIDRELSQKIMKYAGAALSAINTFSAPIQKRLKANATIAKKNFELLFSKISPYLKNNQEVSPRSPQPVDMKTFRLHLKEYLKERVRNSDRGITVWDCRGKIAFRFRSAKGLTDRSFVTKNFFWENFCPIFQQAEQKNSYHENI